MSYPSARIDSYNHRMPRKRNLTRTGRYPLHKRIGDFVDAERLRLGLDYKEIANEMGHSQSQLSKLVAGDARWTAEHIISLARVLKVSPVLLLNAGVPPDPSVRESTPSGSLSDAASRVSPEQLSRWFGEFGDDVTPREKRWMEKVAEAVGTVENAPEKFWRDVLEAYRRTRKPSR